MNTSDRSLAIVDIAIRRRFAFAKLWPQLSVVERGGCDLMQDAFQRLLAIFVDHATDDAMELVPGSFLFSGAGRTEGATATSDHSETVAGGLPRHRDTCHRLRRPFAPTCNGSIRCEPRRQEGGRTAAPFRSYSQLEPQHSLEQRCLEVE